MINTLIVNGIMYMLMTTPAVGFVIKGNTIKVEVTVYQFGLQSAKGTVTIYL